MVSWGGHILPVIVVIGLWFFATGLIAWLDNRERATFPRSLLLAGACGIGGLITIAVAAQFVSVLAVYAAFLGALMVWAWHEASFLMGAVAGPRTGPCPPDARGWERFSHASATLIYHEIALAVTAVLLVSLCWNAPNQIGAMAFTLLLVLRLSSKLNIFVGVPNMSSDILPPHLEYLKTYFGPAQHSWMLLLSVLGCGALATWLGMQAYGSPAGSAEAVGASLLFALAVLGTLEHVFLALPLRDSALWDWAIPNKRRSVPAPTNTKN